ncbi:MAG TPA: DNA polymerase III subunit beta [Ignavibacteriaceae bacterium]|nr:DNA polymerase III subunit beta [Ignavibacteriaceae bacterium]
MEFKLNSRELEKVLSKLILAIPQRSPIPTLENFLFEVSEEQLTISATDMQIYLTASIPVSSDGSKEMLIPGKFLYDIIRSLGDTQILFKVENDKVKLKTDNGVYNLSSLENDDYHKLPSFDKERAITFQGNVLKKCFDQTLFAVSKGEMGRAAMTGILMEFNKDGLNFVATDGHRLVKYTSLNQVTDINDQFIVPDKTISIVSKLITDSQVTVNFSKTNILFEFNDIKLVSRLIGEKYPAYNSVIPLENENKLKVNVKELLSAVKRMLIFSSSSTSNQVKFAIQKDLLEISSEDIDKGANAVESLQCEYDGDPMVIGFNTSYVNDVLSHVNDKECIFKLHSPTKAAVIEQIEKKEDEKLLMLLMPVRLNN